MDIISGSIDNLESDASQHVEEFPDEHVSILGRRMTSSFHGLLRLLRLFTAFRIHISRFRFRRTRAQQNRNAKLCNISKSAPPPQVDSSLKTSHNSKALANAADLWDLWHFLCVPCLGGPEFLDLIEFAEGMKTLETPDSSQFFDF